MSDSPVPMPRRRSWWWGLAAALVGVPHLFIRPSQMRLGDHDRVAVVVMVVASTLAGVVVQRFGPSDKQLDGAGFFAALFVVGSIVLMIVPGDVGITPDDMFIPMGGISGMVLATWWERRQARHAAKREESGVRPHGQ